MAIIYSFKCTVPFSFVLPMLSLSVTHCHLLALVVPLVVTLCTTRCHSLYHSLSFVVTRCTTRCYSLSLAVPLVVTCCTTRCHSLSFVFTRCTTRLSFYEFAKLRAYAPYPSMIHALPIIDMRLARMHTFTYQ